MKRERYQRRLDALIKKYGEDNVVYCDESGFKAHTGRLSGWAQKGQKLYAEVTGKQDKKTNLLTAQRGKEHLSPFVFTGTYTAALVTQWVEDMLIKTLHTPSIVIMDNAPVHNKRRLRSLLKRNGHAFLPLPPYFPGPEPHRGHVRWHEKTT